MPTKTGTSPKRTEPVRVEPDPSAKGLPSLGAVESAVISAVDQAPWISPADSGAVALAIKLARDIDRTGTDEATQMAALARTLLATLAAIGLTVAGRIQSDTLPPSEENPLDVLRSRAAGRIADASSSDSATVRPIPRR